MRKWHIGHVFCRSSDEEKVTSKSNGLWEKVTSKSCGLWEKVTSKSCVLWKKLWSEIVINVMWCFEEKVTLYEIIYWALFCFLYALFAYKKHEKPLSYFFCYFWTTFLGRNNCLSQIKKMWTFGPQTYKMHDRWFLFNKQKKKCIKDIS